MENIYPLTNNISLSRVRNTTKCVISEERLTKGEVAIRFRRRVPDGQIYGGIWIKKSQIGNFISVMKKLDGVDFESREGEKFGENKNILIRDSGGKDVCCGCGESNEGEIVLYLSKEGYVTICENCTSRIYKILESYIEDDEESYNRTVAAYSL